MDAMEDTTNMVSKTLSEHARWYTLLSIVYQARKKQREKNAMIMDALVINFWAWKLLEEIPDFGVPNTKKDGHPASWPKIAPTQHGL